MLSPALEQFSPKTAPLYVRLFDVDYSAGYGGGVPAGNINIHSLALERPVVPVVFVTNRVFSKVTAAADIDSLATKIAQRTQRYMAHLAEKLWDSRERYIPWERTAAVRDSFCRDWTQRYIHEIQIDCDWTASTREQFFRLLKTLKKHPVCTDRTLSCTIRLHQFRDRKTTGIPPAERGTLMCYNLTSPKDTSTRDAIFDLALLQNYLGGQPRYPLPLDVALPVFNWGAWYRGGEFRGLLSNWTPTNCLDSNYFSPIAAQMYQVRRDTVCANNYLREGDLIRLDGAEDEDLRAALPLLKPLFSSQSRLIFFDWDTAKIHRYEQIIPSMLSGF